MARVWYASLRTAPHVPRMCEPTLHHEQLDKQTPPVYHPPRTAHVCAHHHDQLCQELLAQGVGNLGEIRTAVSGIRTAACGIRTWIRTGTCKHEGGGMIVPGVKESFVLTNKGHVTGFACIAPHSAVVSG